MPGQHPQFCAAWLQAAAVGRGPEPRGDLVDGEGARQEEGPAEGADSQGAQPALLQDHPAGAHQVSGYMHVALV